MGLGPGFRLGRHFPIHMQLEESPPLQGAEPVWPFDRIWPTGGGDGIGGEEDAYSATGKPCQPDRCCACPKPSSGLRHLNLDDLRTIESRKYRRVGGD